MQLSWGLQDAEYRLLREGLGTSSPHAVPGMGEGGIHSQTLVSEGCWAVGTPTLTPGVASGFCFPGFCSPALGQGQGLAVSLLPVPGQRMQLLRESRRMLGDRHPTLQGKPLLPEVFARGNLQSPPPPLPCDEHNPGTFFKSKACLTH